jgi:D-alanine transaminase
MTEWIWLNGRVLPMAQASISVEDRGFQFADGIYEVIRLHGSKPYALEEHLVRLEQSADGIQLPVPLTRPALAEQIAQFLPRAGVEEGMIYLQLTRGAGPRNHLFPDLSGQQNVQPTLLFYARPLPPVKPVDQAPGVKLLPLPDERWQRCWIKSIALLPNVLAKSAAAAAGADEAVFIDQGVVTECSASNIFALLGGKLVTHPVGTKVLPGITRAALLRLAASLGLSVQERPWTADQAMDADELFITSTTRPISWVSHWNGQPVKPGRCGPVTRKLHVALRESIARDLADE